MEEVRNTHTRHKQTEKQHKKKTHIKCNEVSVRALWPFEPFGMVNSSLKTWMTCLISPGFP